MLPDWQETLNGNPTVAAGADLCQQIESLCGHSALIVGGTVRDLVMGESEVHDVDIATDASIEVLGRHFVLETIGRSDEFGIVTIAHRSVRFEVANFRTEAGYSDRRRPDSVTLVRDFLQDSRRRDFTINAMALNAQGGIIDHHGGLRDIREGRIRTIGDPYERFAEDALRMLRAVRFAARFDFEIEPITQVAIRDLGGWIQGLSADRLREELFKAASLGGPRLARFIYQLDAAGLLGFLLPEVKSLQGLPHDPKHHPEGHVYEHVLAALAASPSRNPVNNLAVLFHDLGKATTRGIGEQGQPTYHGHEIAGVPLFDAIAHRLNFSNDEAEAIRVSVEQHMYGHKLASLTDRLLLRLRQNPHWSTLQNTIYCDEKARLHLFDPAAYSAKMDKVEQVFREYGDAVAMEARLTELIDGRQIMTLVPEAKGPAIGAIKKAVREWILDRKFDVTQEQVVERIQKEWVQIQVISRPWSSRTTTAP